MEQKSRTVKAWAHEGKKRLTPNRCNRWAFEQWNTWPVQAALSYIEGAVTTTMWMAQWLYSVMKSMCKLILTVLPYKVNHFTSYYFIVEMLFLLVQRSFPSCAPGEGQKTTVSHQINGGTAFDQSDYKNSKQWIYGSGEEVHTCMYFSRIIMNH